MIRHLKSGQTAEVTAEKQAEVRRTVEGILENIAKNGERAVREYSQKFDQWSPESFRLSEREIRECVDQVPDSVKRDIEFAQTQIRNFALAQRAALKDVEVETMPGVVLGHKNIPVNSVGCYVPGGRYPMVAQRPHERRDGEGRGRQTRSFPRRLLSAASRIRRSSPPCTWAEPMRSTPSVACRRWPRWRWGPSTSAPVDMIVGPGNAFVAEAKRQLFGRVGIDLLAGPTETLIIADDSCDAEMAAVDLIGQAEHGPGSPAVLLTNSREARAGSARRNREAAVVAADRAMWRGSHGRTAVRSFSAIRSMRWCGGGPDRLRARAGADARSGISSCSDMTNYGALFLGARTNVAYGDKVIGTNHTLPTMKAARYTGGLVGRQIHQDLHLSARADR